MSYRRDRSNLHVTWHTWGADGTLVVMLSNLGRQPVSVGVIVGLAIDYNGERWPALRRPFDRFRRGYLLDFIAATYNRSDPLAPAAQLEVGFPAEAIRENCFDPPRALVVDFAEVGGRAKAELAVTKTEMSGRASRKSEWAALQRHKLDPTTDSPG